MTPWVVTVSVPWPVPVGGANGDRSTSVPWMVAIGVIVETSMLKVVEADAPLSSVTVMVTGVAAWVAVGVPDTWPVLGSSETPVGRLPPVTAYDRGAVPPVDWIENGVIASSLMKLLLPGLVTAIAETLKLKSRVASVLALSVTLAVTAQVQALVGVP